MLPQIESRIKQLDVYYENHVLPAKQAETQSHLCKLGTVMVCGFIERSVEMIVFNRLQNKAQPQVLKFIKSHFKKEQITTAKQSANCLYALMITGTKSFGSSL